MACGTISDSMVRYLDQTERCPWELKPSSSKYKKIGMEKIVALRAKPLCVHPIDPRTSGIDKREDELWWNKIKKELDIDGLPTLRESSRKFANYVICGELGRGSSSKIELAIDKRGVNEYALKLFRELPHEFSDSVNEVQFFRRTRHLPYMVKCYDFFVPKPNLGVLVLERLGPNLYESCLKDPRAKPGMPLDNVRKLGFQLLVVLEHLELLSIIHRDIKPENICFNIENGHMKLFDFGHGGSVGGSDPIKGTIWYRSPEIMLGHTHYCPLDVWSVGCVLGEAYLGTPLFPSRCYGGEENLLEQMALYVQAIGMPSKAYLKTSPLAPNFFDLTGDSCIIKGAGEVFKPGRGFDHSLLSIKILKKAQSSGEFSGGVRFVNVLDEIFRFERRISPTRALAMPFFSDYLIFALEISIKGHAKQLPLTLSLLDVSKVKMCKPLEKPLWSMRLSTFESSTMESCPRATGDKYGFYLEGLGAFPMRLLASSLELHSGCKLVVSPPELTVHPPNRPKRSY